MSDRRRRPLSIRFVNAHYAPDVAASGEYLTDLAEGLAERGYTVHVVTGQAPYQRSSLVAPEEEVRNGVRVTRVRAPSPPGTGGLARIGGYLSFLLGAAPTVLGGPRPDITVYLTTPPLLGALGLLGKALAGRPYGIWTMDLHPEAEVAHGLLRPDAGITRLLATIDRWIFRHAAFVGALGGCMARRIESKLPAGRGVPNLPLWKGEEEVRPLPRTESPFARKWEVGDRFVVMYSGNAGLAHGFEEVKGLLRHCKEDPGVLTLFIGAGQRRVELERFIEAEGIDNARYLDYVPRRDVGTTLPLADLHLITLLPEWEGIAVPSKVFGIMASGRPIAMVGPPESEVSRIIERSGCGRVIDPRLPDATRALIDFVDELRQDRERADDYGRRGRAALEAEYTRDAGIDRWERAMLESLSQSPPSGRSETSKR